MTLVITDQSVVYPTCTNFSPRIGQAIDIHQHGDQAGFGTGRSTVDHIFSLNQLLEKTSEFNFPVYMTFVDYEKAFDSVETNAILNALHEQNVHSHYIKPIRNIYTSATSTLQLHTEGSPFTLARGVWREIVGHLSCSLPV